MWKGATLVKSSLLRSRRLARVRILRSSSALRFRVFGQCHHNTLDDSSDGQRFLIPCPEARNITDALVNAATTVVAELDRRTQQEVIAFAFSACIPPPDLRTHRSRTFA